MITTVNPFTGSKYHQFGIYSKAAIIGRWFVASCVLCVLDTATFKVWKCCETKMWSMRNSGLREGKVALVRPGFLGAL